MISWIKENFNFQYNGAETKDIESLEELCKEENSLVVFPEPNSRRVAIATCTAHGGTLVVPKSKSENDELYDIMKSHENKCVHQNRVLSNNGKLLWLGITSYDRVWSTINSEHVIVPVNYTNWGRSVEEVTLYGRSNGCVFMTTKGDWAHASTTCADMMLCFVCSIPKSTVFTLKGTCDKGSVFQWNYYLSINNTNEISSYEGYKRGQRISNVDGIWTSET